MGIRGQMVGEQVHVVAKQGPQTLTAQAGDATILTTPEIAVMHQHRIRLPRHRRIEQSLAGRHAANHPAYLSTSFHLQPVWAIIPEAPEFEQIVELTLPFGSFHGRLSLNPCTLAAHPRATL